jgi:peptidoglycan/LPS O-acetylase OafA/YrhL
MPANTERAYPGTEYRPDIDGLRAIAVLAVIGFHMDTSHLRWGFAGVDVFFVISGFLISGIVFRSLDRGTFSLREFYTRRINRIFPALLVVLAACVPIGWTILVSGELALLGKHIAAGAAFVLNFVLSGEEGYFFIRGRPLLHLWSLAVEEQFYILFPAAAFIAWRIRARMRPILIVLIGVSLGLTAWSIYEGSQRTAFYYPTTRIWEILAGALVCDLQYRGTRLQRALRGHKRLIENLAALASMALLVATTRTARSGAWPGWPTLLPVLGTALLIAAGRGAFINRHLLSSRLLVGIGLISYPLYLWHLPLLVYARVISGDEKPVFWVRVALVILSFVLAWATYRFVEVPIRFGSRKRRSAAILIGLMAVAGLLGVFLWQRGLGPRIDPAITAKIEAAQRDFEFPSTGGFFGRGPRIIIHDIVGDSSRTVLVIGDSHAEHYWARMVELSRRSASPRRRIRFITYPGCTNLPGVERRGAAHHGSAFRCAEFYEKSMILARSPDVSTIVLSTWWDAQLDGNRYLARTGEELRQESASTEEAYTMLARDIRQLVSMGKSVYIILSNPTGPDFSPATMFPSRIPFVDKHIDLSVSGTARPFRNPWLADRLRRVADEGGASVIDPAEAHCTAAECAKAGADSVPIYADGNHYRSSWVRHHATFIDAALNE